MPSDKGIRPEWHLLKLRGVAMFADVRSGDRTWFGEQRVGFWPSLDGPGLETSGPVADPLVRDQAPQAFPRRVAVATMAMMFPGDPELQGVLETQLAWPRVGA